MDDHTIPSLDVQGVESLTAPRQICESCGADSGPKFLLSELRGPSDAHRANIVPTGHEREIKLLDIDRTQSEISRLDDEIDRLQQVLSSLQQRRDTLKKFNIQEQSLLAPIRKLPADVLQHLFVVALYHFTYDGFISICQPKSFIRTITQVSAYWRYLAHSCPTLWSRITFDTFYSSQPRYMYTGGRLLERYISLSREVPVHLKFDSDLGIPKYLEDGAIQAVAKSSHRWEVAEFNDYTGELLQAIESYLPQDVIFTCLKSLSISYLYHSISFNHTPALIRLSVVGREGLHTPLQTPTIFLRSAPSLTSLSVTGQEDFQNTLVEFPWSQITQFESRDNTFTEGGLAVVFELMDNLTSLTLYGTKITTPIALPKLQTLKIVDDTDTSSEQTDVLNIFIAPCLKALHLELEFNSAEIMELLERSHCVLEEVTLTNIRLDDKWKAQLQKVKKLCLYKPSYITNNLRWLIKHNENISQEPPSSGVLSDYVLPEVEELHIKRIPFDTKRVVLKMLITMLESRLPPILLTGNTMSNDTEVVSYLKLVTIDFDRKLNRKEKAFLKKFIASDIVRMSGVVITIHHGREGYAGEDARTNTDMNSEDL
ncbi:hypothetical protein BDQ17DRAFT_1544589 [Cyathus striatus]|nr:hypothetical protein BDQ17DRAFT_1544589 [Cyathus striatus]